MSWLKENLRAIRAVGAAVFAVLVVSTIFDQLINSRLEDLLLSDDGGGTRLWFLAGASLLNGLIFPVMVTALCLHGILGARGSRETLGAFIGRVANQLYIETMRAWGSCLRWGLLLVLPGFVRLFQLIFVPYVVCLSAEYERGEVDALKSSASHLRRVLWRTIFAALILQLIVPLILTDVLDPWRSYLDTPMTALACSILDVIFAFVTVQIFFRIFESARRRLGAAPAGVPA